MSSKHKTNSFCKRLQRVSAAAIQQHNFDEYNESLYAFLQAINWPQYQTPPPCLVFPLGFFYYKKRPAGICSLFPFPFGRHQSYRVTNRTFPIYIPPLALQKRPLFPQVFGKILSVRDHS